MISHHHKCVFVHVPKCGGQSIETAFLHDIGLDWRRRAPLLLRSNRIPELGPPVLAHLLARDYVAMRYMPQDMFDSYFKFSVVRNPYRRIVSTYQYLDVNLPFEDFLDSHLRGGDAGELRYFLRPQLDFLTDRTGMMLVDNVYKLEEIKEGFHDIQQKTGLQTALPHVNSSASAPEKHKRKKPLGVLKQALRDRSLSSAKKGLMGAKDVHDTWQNYFRDETSRAKVAEYYKADFAALGYASAI